MNAWVESQLYTVATYTINETVYTYHIYRSGKVFHADGTLVCETGGEACLTDYIDEMMAKFQTTTVSVTVNGVEMTFTIDVNGRVTNERGEIICQTGG